VELALEASQDVVVDRALGAEPQEGLAFRVDDRSSDLAVLDELSILPVGRRRVALPLDVLGTVLIRVAQPIEERAVPRPHRIELFDPPRRGVEQLLPGPCLFFAEPGIGAEPKPANAPAQRPPLAHD